MPEVDETTEFTYEIETTSTQDGDNSADLVLTITVNPVLTFLSYTAVDGIVVPPNNHLLTFMIEGEVLM